MSRYTIRGSDGLDVRINADLNVIAKAVAPFSAAGVLIGGYGRGEGSPYIQPDGTQLPFNDYDLVIVVDQLDRRVRERFRAFEKELSDQLGLPVDLCPYRRARLSRCEFSLLNYEMKCGHRVIWGDPHILDALPDYPTNAIPLSEGSRLLLNRGKLLFDIRRRLRDPKPLDSEERIRYVKFIHKALLAFGDCALLAAGRYDISYSLKKSRIREIGDIPDRDFIIDGFQRAVELKEWGDYRAFAEYDIKSAFDSTCCVFLRFFAWYRNLHPSRECSAAKAIVLNLRWFRFPYLSHPRLRLYDALQELLSEEPDRILLGQILSCSRNIEEHFLKLCTRFS